jgi:voltage-gated potassium channel
MARGHHVVIALLAFGGIVVIGTIGYIAFGFTVLEALYQTVTTVTTVGFREVQPIEGAAQVFTIVLIVAGVGTALYTLTVVLELVVEGHLGAVMDNRRMRKRITGLEDHVIVCGWGRVGQAIADDLAEAGRDFVVIDSIPTPVGTVQGGNYLVGDATSDEVLREAGIEKAAALVSALPTDAENLFVTLSGRALKPDLFIVARAIEETSVAKLARAGADRVVNPQEIGGSRMAAHVLQPHVTAFLDVAMRARSIELRLGEVEVPPDSPFVGKSLRKADVREQTGALVLALRNPDGTYLTHPHPETELLGGQILIAIGTDDHLRALAEAAGAGVPSTDGVTS